MRRLSLLFLLVSNTAGCSDEEWTVQLGRLFQPNPIQVEVRGNEVEVTVTTEGGGCVELHSTEVVASVDGATIEVYHGPRKCPAFLQAIHHRATITFDYPGVKSFLIHSAPRIEPWTGEEIPTVHVVTESVY